MKELSLLQASIDFFGLKPGEDRMTFMKHEFKPLTDDDRKEIAAGLEKNGYKITGPILAQKIEQAKADAPQ